MQIPVIGAGRLPDRISMPSACVLVAENRMFFLCSRHAVPNLSATKQLFGRFKSDLFLNPIPANSANSDTFDVLPVLLLMFAADVRFCSYRNVYRKILQTGIRKVL